MRVAPASLALAAWLGVVVHPARANAPIPAASAAIHAPALATEEAPPPRPAIPWAQALPALVVHDTNAGVTGEARLYADDGALSLEGAQAFDRVLAGNGADAPRALDRRLLQLVVKAAAHFGATHLSVVSSWRDSSRKGSRHRSGQAMDFVLDGVPPAKLAAYLRKGARVGVGIYTHRRTQFVHLDVREQSFHWLDASPPGRVWRELGITEKGALARDDAYEPAQDLPEPPGVPGARAPGR